VLLRVFVPDLPAPGVHHGQKGHAPLLAVAGDLAQSVEHMALVFRSHIDMNAHSVRSHLESLLHCSHQDLVVGIRPQRGRGREMYDQTQIPAVSAMAE